MTRLQQVVRLLVYGVWSAVFLFAVLIALEFKAAVFDRIEWLDHRLTKVEQSSIIPSINIQTAKTIYSTGGEVVIEELKDER
jgi:hypothetical protein